MSPPYTTAASLVPSMEEVMVVPHWREPASVRSVHVTPESVEVQMSPGEISAAASLETSVEEVIDPQPREPAAV